MNDMTHTEPTKKMSRRAFLRNVSLLAASSLLAACAVGPEPQPAEQFDPTINRVNIPAPQTEAQEASSELTEFLQLSALLTGVDNLDPEVGQIYLQSLQRAEEGMSVAALLEEVKAGASALPATFEEVEQSGIFDNEASRTLADTIIEQWYTGVYQTAEGEPALATYVDALAWKMLAFAKPMSVCGSYRFWTEPPEEAID